MKIEDTIKVPRRNYTITAILCLLCAHAVPERAFCNRLRFRFCNHPLGPIILQIWGADFRKENTFSTCIHHIIGNFNYSAIKLTVPLIYFYWVWQILAIKWHGYGIIKPFHQCVDGLLKPLNDSHYTHTNTCSWYHLKDISIISVNCV